ncbi:MAG: phosphopantetheine-binding protein [Pseudomonadota bacterium]
MNELKTELKQLVIDALDLEDVTVDDIDSSEPLFIEGLGLDSIDALELGLALQKRYGIKLAADSEETRKHFASIDSLAELVASHKDA